MKKTNLKSDENVDVKEIEQVIVKKFKGSENDKRFWRNR